MTTFLKKSIAILFGTVFFVGGASMVSAAIIDTDPSKGVILDTAVSPTFGGQGSILTPISDSQTSGSINLGGTVATPAPSFGSQLVNPDPGTTAIMAGAIASVNQAQAAVSTAQTAYDAAVASGNTSAITAALTSLKSAQATLANVSGVSATAQGTTISTEDAILSAADAQCGWRTMTGCVLLVPIYFTYYLVYKPAAILLTVAGLIFDFALSLSIDKTFINQGFVASSWTVIRDFSNMAFIFILLYTGISTMLGMGNWRKTVIQVVIIALLINFSLFFTKIVIDAGNILAVGIYSSMGQVPAAGQSGNLSAALVSSIQPQNFITTAAGVGAVNSIMIFVVAAIVNIAVAYALFSVALIFVGRILAFWFLMIISPFAFISTALPKGNKFGWWLDMLLAQAFVAPIFLFALYLILQIINSGVLSTITSSATGAGGFTNAIIIPVLIATILVVAILKAKDLAKGMAGEFGQLGAKLGGAVMGVAGGAVLGGAAVAGRKVVGGAAQRLADKGAFQDMAAGDSKVGRFVGRMGVLGTEKARTGTFDARGVGLVQKGIKQTGVNMGAVGAGAKGGYAGMAKRQETADLKRAELFTVSEGEKGAIKSKYDVAVKEKESAKHTEEAGKHAGRVAAADEAVKTASKKAEEARAAHEASRDITGVGDATLAKALADATKEEQSALSELKGSQNDLAAAREATTKAVKEFDDAKAQAEKEIDALQKQRDEAQAQYVESGTGKLISHAGAGAAGLGLTYSHSQAQKTAAKIRAGKTKDEKEKAATAKKLLKALKDMEEKSAEHKEEEKPAEAAH